MSVTASQLRQDIYRLIDQVLATGQPLEIERKGQRLRLIADQPVSRLARIRGNPAAIVGDPEELVTLPGVGEWDAGRAIEP